MASAAIVLQNASRNNFNHVLLEILRDPRQWRGQCLLQAQRPRKPWTRRATSTPQQLNTAAHTKRQEETEAEQKRAKRHKGQARPEPSYPHARSPLRPPTPPPDHPPRAPKHSRVSRLRRRACESRCRCRQWALLSSGPCCGHNAVDQSLKTTERKAKALETQSKETTSKRMKETARRPQARPERKKNKGKGKKEAEARHPPTTKPPRAAPPSPTCHRLRMTVTDRAGIHALASELTGPHARTHDSVLQLPGRPFPEVSIAIEEFPGSVFMSSLFLFVFPRRVSNMFPFLFLAPPPGRHFWKRNWLQRTGGIYKVHVYAYI